MLRLVSTPDKPPDADLPDAPPADYMRSCAYRKLDQLLFRVLQLDDILHHRCAFNPEKANRIKSQIEDVQEQLERVYTRIDDGKSRRSTMRRVGGAPAPDATST
jgi:hypothetical protein